MPQSSPPKSAASPVPPQDLQRLARAVALSDGFALYIIIHPTVDIARQALECLRKEIARVRGTVTPNLTVLPAQTDGNHIYQDQGLTVNTLLESPSKQAYQYFVLDASEFPEDDQQALRFLFERLNERRNLLIERLQRPLILVIPAFAESMLVRVAPDFWSIRAMPAIVLSESQFVLKSTASENIQSLPEVAVSRRKRGPIEIVMLHAEEDQEFALAIERHLRPLLSQRLVKIWSPYFGLAAGEPWHERIQQRIRSADLILVLVSPDLIETHQGDYIRWLSDAELQNRLIIPILLRPVDLHSIPVLGERQRLPRYGHALSHRQVDRDQVFAELTREIARVINHLRHKPRQSGPISEIRILFLHSLHSKLNRYRGDAIVQRIDRIEEETGVNFTVMRSLVQTPEDIQRCLQKYEPDIVHCASLEEMQLLAKTPSISNFIHAARLSCVIVGTSIKASGPLEARLAEITEHIVGLSDTLTEVEEDAFLFGFYRALAYGSSIPEAFQEGQTRLALEGYRERSERGGPILFTSPSFGLR